MQAQNDWQQTMKKILPRPPFSVSPSTIMVRIATHSFLVIVTMAAWFFREPLRELVFAQGVWANDGPSEEIIEQVIDGASDRQAPIQKPWDSDKVVPREVAIRRLLRRVP